MRSWVLSSALSASWAYNLWVASWRQTTVWQSMSRSSSNIAEVICHLLICLCLFFVCFWTVVLEKTLESPLDCKEIQPQPVHSKGDQPWVFFGKNDAEAEIPVLWPPHAKSWLIGKDSDDGRDWEQEEKGTTEDEMAGWHHGLDGRESEWTPGVGDGQGGLVCCDSWDHKETDMMGRLNWTDSCLQVL